MPWTSNASRVATVGANKARPRPMAFPKLLSMPQPAIAAGYIAGYVALDWISFLHPFGPFGITPWNPPTGLSFVLILLFGQRYLPLLFLAPLLADLIVRGSTLSLPVAFLASGVIGAGYSVAALALLSPAMRLDVSLSYMRDLALLLLVAVLSSSGVAAAVVAVYAASGMVAWSDFGHASLRHWVGDLIGISVVTPFLLIILTRGRPARIGAEAVLQSLAILVSLVIVFTFGQSRQLQLFYLLFLPVIWIAVRSGLEGVTAGLALTQIGLIIGLQRYQPTGAEVTAYQALMLVLVMTGLAVGVLVTERRRAELQLRLQQEAQARLARLGSMGELASALAHEINQPLMAAGTYSRLVAAAIAEGKSPDMAREAAAKAVAQVERASEVVRRLRTLIKLGRSDLAPVRVPQILAETLELLRPEIDRAGVRVEQRLAGSIPPVMGDMLQIQQVLINLLRNAIEAISDAAQERGTITIQVSRGDPGYLDFEVRDTGPGFPPGFAADTPEPLKSTKTYGLGVGLSLSRSIVEAHGGRLVIARTSGGAAVRFSLPVVEGAA